MEPVASVVERIKGFARSSESFFNDAFHRCSISSTHNSTEILKRLQREAFSELMKLRERQDKVERMLSFYKSGKGGPFQDANTHMKGIVDVVGALLFVDNDDQQARDALDKAGMRTGIDLRFTFDTALRQTDHFVAEFVASQSSHTNHDNLSRLPLALEKMMYLANISDWLSVITTPLGAQCNDYGIGSYFSQGKSRGRFSSFMPPLFSQVHSCGAGVMVKGSNISASLAELLSVQEMLADAAGSRHMSTFGQLTYYPFDETRLTFSCLWQTRRSPCQLFKLGTVAIPVGRLKRRAGSSVQAHASSSANGRPAIGNTDAGSVALMVDSECDESTNLGGWIEVQKLSPKLLQWGLSFSDTPQDELGWGFRMGGKFEGHFSQLQLEGFLNFNLGKKLVLQPGLMYAMDGRSQTPALIFRSSWDM